MRCGVPLHAVPGRRIIVRMRLPFVILIVTLAAAVLPAAEKPAPPTQPDRGPGGRDYAHRTVRPKYHGTGATAYWLFEPADPAPKTAPVIVFNHGWLAMHPRVYRAWIDHLVRRGNVVIYPRYQDGVLTPPRTFVDNAVTAVTAALAELRRPGRVAPDTGRLAVVGHSAGGGVSVGMAARAAKAGLPKPRALMAVQPWRGRAGRMAVYPAADYKKIPAEIRMLVVVGDADRVVGERSAVEIFRSLRQVPAAHKDYITVNTDRRGRPPLVAGHMSPCAFPGGADALDYYAYWRLFDALCACAFDGTHADIALGGGSAAQTDMGRWSDGTPVKRLTVTDDP